jgi:hypothetical protein
VKCIQIARRQCLFLGARPAFDLAFPVGSGNSIGMFLHENNLPCTENTGGSTSFSRLVFSVAAWRIVGVADVETIVVHLKDV